MNKTRETKAVIEEHLIGRGFGRDRCIIALGGGVVTDLVGFLAATYCRGVPVIYYATNLLAATDASIGGKTAVDTPHVTNYIGVIRQPSKLYIDISCWQTLPVKQLRLGLSETIKHACISDSQFFAHLEDNLHKVVDPKGNVVLERTVCEHIAYENCRIKRDVVVQEEKEGNLRQVLNLGHTVGRALEPLTNYRLSHGEAVSIGLSCESIIAHAVGLLSQEEVGRVEVLLGRAGLPTRIPNEITTDELIGKMHTDKKSSAGQIRMVLLQSIGETYCGEDGKYSRPFEDHELRRLISKVRLTQQYAQG